MLCDAVFVKCMQSDRNVIGLCRHMSAKKKLNVELRSQNGNHVMIITMH